MLLIIILAACFGLALFGLTMCRLAARSDASDTVALAEWIATSQLASIPVMPTDSSGEERRYEPPDEPYQATG